MKKLIGAVLVTVLAVSGASYMLKQRDYAEVASSKKSVMVMRREAQESLRQLNGNYSATAVSDAEASYYEACSKCAAKAACAADVKANTPKTFTPCE